MQVETENLLTISNFGKEKGITRQHIYRLVDAKRITKVEIDGIAFILKDELANMLERQRRHKTKKTESILSKD